MISLKNSHKAVIILLTIVMCLQTLHAQYYRTGSEPAGVSWRHIETDHIQVIFPAEQSELAQMFTSKFEYALQYFKPKLRKKPKKLSIILHNYHSRSNGMMSWAPRRMELWTRPPQDLAAQDWLELLIVHEYRHFIQISNLDQGFTTALKWLLGQQGQLIPLGFHIPMWYLEGDAVVSETMYSKAGRGRDPSFNQAFRALVVERGIPSYDQLFLGSYKTYVPDHYQTGYDIVAAHLLHTSATVFDEKMDNIANHPFYLNPFKTMARGLRDRGRKKFYKEAIQILDSIWQSQKMMRETEEDFVLIEPSDYINIEELKQDGDVLYGMAESFNVSPSLVSVHDGMLQWEQQLGYSADPEIDVVNHQLAWVESRQNPRWDQQSYSDVWVMNLTDKRKKRLTDKRYLASPALNPEYKTLAVVEYHPDYTFNLLILDSETGTVVFKPENPENEILFHPAWSEDGETLIYISLGKNGKSIKSWNKAEGTSTLFVAGFNEISNPICLGGKVYFTGGFDGINQIYSYSKSNGVLMKHTNAPFGADYAAVSKKTHHLYCTSWHSNGSRIVKCNLSDGERVALSELEPPKDRFAEALTDELGEEIDFENRPVKRYRERKYSKLTHSLNLHSWYPLSVDLDNNQFYPGITLLSQDVLGNSELTFNYNANPSMKDEMFSAGYTYYGVWPNIHLDYSYGFDNTQAIIEGTTIDLDNRYHTVDASLSFPLNLSKHTWYRGVRPVVGIEFAQRKSLYNWGRGNDFFSNRFVPLSLQLSGYCLKQMAKRDLEFPWGVHFLLAYSTSLGNEDDAAQIAYVNQGSVGGYGVSAYLRGLAPHHSVILNHSFQKKSTGTMYEDEETGLMVFPTMSSLFVLPRGFVDERGENVQMIRYALDYQLPLAYPDLRLGWLAYMKRIGGGIFFDYGQMTDVHHIRQATVSFGGSIYFDCNFLRYEPNVRIGLQMGYNNLSESLFSNLIFSVNMPW